MKQIRMFLFAAACGVLAYYAATLPMFPHALPIPAGGFGLLFGAGLEAYLFGSLGGPEGMAETAEYGDSLRNSVANGGAVALAAAIGLFFTLGGWTLLNK